MQQKHGNKRTGVCVFKDHEKAFDRGWAVKGGQE